MKYLLFPDRIQGAGCVSLTVVSWLLLSYCPFDASHYMLSEVGIQIIIFIVAQGGIPGPAPVELMAPYRRKYVAESIQAFGIFSLERCGVVHRYDLEVDAHLLQEIKFISCRPVPLIGKVLYGGVLLVQDQYVERLEFIVPVKSSSEELLEPPPFALCA